MASHLKSNEILDAYKNTIYFYNLNAELMLLPGVLKRIFPGVKEFTLMDSIFSVYS